MGSGHLSQFMKSERPISKLLIQIRARPNSPLIPHSLRSNGKLRSILGGRIMICFLRLFLAFTTTILITATCALGQQYNPNLFSAMQWRLVGPHRAGRVTTVAGIPGKPAIYYFGTPGGGLWKTTDGGRVWKPIFDDAHVPSISALAVSPSK